MATLEQTTGYKNGKKLTQEMARILKGTPHDPSQPIPFTFYLYLPDKRTATACAKVLKTKDCETEVEQSAADDGQWLCLCHATCTLTDGTVSQLGDRLIQLAREYGGTFDGWEVDVYKIPGALADLMSLLAEMLQQTDSKKSSKKPAKKPLKKKSTKKQPQKAPAKKTKQTKKK